MSKTNDSLVVAGAGADGHGVICGYRGEGAMSRLVLADLVRSAGLPESWLPAPKDARVQLQRAVAAVAGEYNLRAARDEKRGRKVAWVSRWALWPTAGDLEVGASVGTVALTVTLADDEAGTLTFETARPELESAIRGEYADLVGAALYQAADITKWLHEIHRERLGGVRLGSNWYVPRAKRSIAEAITAAFGERWGDSWIAPPLPVATSDQLASGIASGLIAEVAEVLADLANQRKQRAADGASDIGVRAAEGFMVRFRHVGTRVDMYAELLGPARVDQVRDAIGEAMVQLDSVLGAEETRVAA